MSSLQGKVAIVTGGGRGIGAATAKLLASRGAKVVVNYFSNSESAEGVVSEIKAAGGDAIALQADVRDAAQISKLVEGATSTYGRIDILVSNANMSFAMKPFVAMSWEEFSEKLNDEMKAAFETTKAVVPTMIEQKYGRIIYISSGLGKNPGPNFIAHGTAKGALDSFSRYIAQELGQHGITANVVAPGLTETDATAHQPAEGKKYMAALTPLQRIAQPEDIASVVAFFASDESGFMTGTYAPVNGGKEMV